MKKFALASIWIIAIASAFFAPEFAHAAFALALYAGPDCSDCDGNAQAEVEFTDCPTLYESEINHIYIVDSEDGEPVVKPTNISDPAAWALELHQVTAGKIRKLTGIGTLPAPEQEQVEISNRRKAFGLRTYTPSLTIDEFSLKNYAWARELQCGGTKHIWIETVGGFLYGGDNGIKVTVIPPNMPLESGENVYKTIVASFEWKAKFDPPVIVSPFATSGNGSSN